MDSVSAVASASAADLLNIAGAPAAGLVVEGYDALPYQSAESAGISGGDAALDSVLINQIEVWADERRESSGSGFEVGYVERLPESESEGSFYEDSEAEPSADEVRAVDGASEDEEEVRRQVRSIERDEQGELIPTSRFLDTSFEERVSIDTDLSDYDRTPGAGFVFDRGSENANRLTAIRDENKPLF